MLQINKSPSAVDQSASASEFISLSDLYSAAVGFARRQFSTIAFAVLCCLALGTVYIFTATPLFTAHAVLVIDAHKAQPWQTVSPLGDMPLDSRERRYANPDHQIGQCRTFGGQGSAP